MNDSIGKYCFICGFEYPLDNKDCKSCNKPCVLYYRTEESPNIPNRIFLPTMTNYQDGWLDGLHPGLLSGYKTFRADDAFTIGFSFIEATFAQIMGKSQPQSFHEHYFYIDIPFEVSSGEINLENSNFNPATIRRPLQWSNEELGFKKNRDEKYDYIDEQIIETLAVYTYRIIHEIDKNIVKYHSDEWEIFIHPEEGPYNKPYIEIDYTNLESSTILRKMVDYILFRMEPRSPIFKI